MQRQPLVSIITVIYNSANTLGRTIQSVVNQSYPNIEHIIVDGGSTDGTLQIIRANEHHIKKWISEKDKGIYDAMNKGIKMAKGELIGTLNSDDWLEQNAIETIVNKYNESGADLICGSIQLWNQDHKDKLFIPFKEGLSKKMTVYHPSTYITKSMYNKHKNYSLEYKQASDYELILRMYKNGAYIYCFDDIITNMSLGGVSDKNWIKGLKEVRKIKMVYFGWFKVNIEFASMLIKDLLIRWLFKVNLGNIYTLYKKRKSKIFNENVIIN